MLRLKGSLMKKITWLIAHEPRHLFERTANAFADKVKELTGGDVIVEPMSAVEYQTINPDFNQKSASDLFQAITDGKVQMSQTQVHQFARWDANYRVFDLPYLFRDHDHATSVLEGEIGTAMNERLAKQSPMRGLAFTYSGGFRVFGSNEPVTSPKELIGKRIRVNHNPINSDFVSAVGGDPKQLFSYGYDEIAAGELDVAETTYIRFLGKYVLKTEHNMFLTTIVISNQLWDSLTSSEQEAFSQAAIEAGRLERVWSIEDSEQFERNCEQNDVTITEVSDEDREYFRSLSHQVYEKWEPKFLPGLVDAIRNTH
jgi:TRAP-type C4-dicarboxylate transport system substrate-binding protein